MREITLNGARYFLADDVERWHREWMRRKDYVGELEDELSRLESEHAKLRAGEAELRAALRRIRDEATHTAELPEICGACLAEHVLEALEAVER